MNYKNEILEILSKNNSHPNAEEIYNLMKKKFPQIGIATVYRNLEQLVKITSIIKVDIPDGPASYDSNLNNHFHIRCTKCKKVDDIYLDIDFNNYIDIEKTIPDYKLSGYNLEFLGLCKECEIKDLN